MKKISTNGTRIILIAAIALFMIPIAHAALSDSFARVFVNIDGFFTGQQYKPYAKTIDFIFFTMFFMALYVQVIKYAFKENTKPVKFIAILFGIMSGFLLVAGGYSVQKLIPYIPWFLFALLSAFYYRLLTGIEWPKSKIWRFILSLLFAFLTIWGLSQLLFPQSNQFGSFFDGFGRVDLPSISAPNSGFAPPTGSVGQGNANVPVVTSECGLFCNTGKLIGEMPWWGWLIPLLLIGSIFGGRSLWGKLKRPRVTPERQYPPLAGGTPNAPEGAKSPLEEVKKEVEEAIKLKEKAWQNVEQIMEKKRAATFTTKDVYHKIFTEWKIDPAELIDRDKQTEASKKLGEEGTTALEIIKLEAELEKHLLELLQLEQSLFGGGVFGAEGSIGKWDRVIVRHFLETSGRIEEVLSPMVGGALLHGEVDPRKLDFRVFNNVDPSQINYNNLKLNIRSFNINLRKLRINKLFNTPNVNLNVPVGNETPKFLDEDIPLEVKYRYTKALMGFVNAFRGLVNQKVTTSVVTDSQHNQISVASQGTVINLLRLIPQYIVFTRKGSATAVDMKKLTNQENLIKWIEAGKYPLWQNRVGKDANEIERIFQQEMELLGIPNKGIRTDGSIVENGTLLKEDKLRFNLLMQIRYLKYLLELIKFLESERKSFTRIQDLWVQVHQNGEWKEVLPFPNLVFNLHGAELYGGRVEIDGTQQSFKVCTRLAGGIVPIKAVCYVDYAKYLEAKRMPELQLPFRVMPEIEFKALSDTIQFEIPTAGLGEGTIIGIFARSEGGTYARMDRKFIQVVFNPPVFAPFSDVSSDPNIRAASSSNSAGGGTTPHSKLESDPVHEKQEQTASESELENSPLTDKKDVIEGEFIPKKASDSNMREKIIRVIDGVWEHLQNIGGQIQKWELLSEDQRKAFINKWIPQLNASEQQKLIEWTNLPTGIKDDIVMRSVSQWERIVGWIKENGMPEQTYQVFMLRNLLGFVYLLENKAPQDPLSKRRQQAIFESVKRGNQYLNISNKKSGGVSLGVGRPNVPRLPSRSGKDVSRTKRRRQFNN